MAPINVSPDAVPAETPDADNLPGVTIPVGWSTFPVGAVDPVGVTYDVCVSSSVGSAYLSWRSFSSLLTPSRSRIRFRSLGTLPAVYDRYHPREAPCPTFFNFLRSYFLRSSRS